MEEALEHIHGDEYGTMKNEDEYYSNLFSELQNQKTNIFDKISIIDGKLGSIAF